MFTGIVQHLGRIASVEQQPFGSALQVDSHGWKHHPNIGDSIAVNGCCLTVAAGSTEKMLRFDVIHQTLRMTALGDVRAGDPVNLEHAVTPQTMLGGHVVQGHIDGVGIVQRVATVYGEHLLRITPNDKPLMECIVEKGSIAIGGVSLTIAKTGDQWFEVALIPTTLELTNLSTLKQGDRVNLETDYVAKIVVNWLRRTGGTLRAV